MTDTDLEQRLGATLVRASDDAPSADGLAARVAARRRRSRRTTATGVCAALAAAAAVVLIAVVPGLGGTDPGPAGREDDRGVGWRTVGVGAGDGTDRIEVEVPGDWDRLDSSGCEFGRLVYGPEDTDPCDVGYPLTVFGSALYDTTVLPGTIRELDGEWSGYVLTGDVAVSAQDADRTVVRRVLASVRLPGEPALEVDTWTREVAEDESDVPDLPSVTAEVPGDPEVSVTLAAGFPDCGPNRSAATPDGNGRWIAGLCRDRFVSVRAPTQALADVVAASVRGY